MRKVKIGAVIAIGLLLLLIHCLNPTFFSTLWAVLSTGDLLGTANYIRSFGSWSIFFSFWLVLCVNAIGFPPAILFSTANTLIFGLFPGILLSVIAETAGVIVSFLFLRYLFRDAAQKVISKHPRLQKIDSFSGKNGFVVMLVARTVPYFPSGLLNAMGALSAISLRDYALASFVGKFPSTSIEAIIGHDAALKDPHPTRMVVVIIVAILLIALAWLYERRQ